MAVKHAAIGLFVDEIDQKAQREGDGQRDQDVGQSQVLRGQ